MVSSTWESSGIFLLYQLQTESPARLVHTLSIDISGRFTLSVVDNLIIVHHQAWKTSMLFDIANEGEAIGSFQRHQPILAPLSLAPTKLEITPSRKSRSSSRGSHPGSSFRSSPNGLGATQIVIPELYLQKWVFFQPNIIVDAQHGVIWKLVLDLNAVSSMMTDKCQLLQFLLMRESGKEVILSVCRKCLEPGRQVNLGVLGGMFDQMNLAFKLSTSRSVEPERKYKVTVTQKDVYIQILVPYADCKDMPYKVSSGSGRGVHPIAQQTTDHGGTLSVRDGHEHTHREQVLLPASSVSPISCYQ